MIYWSGDDILERDILEGEAIFDSSHPHPAYRGAKIMATGDDRLYEVEIIPGTYRMDTIIDPNTFNSVFDKVVDILYRSWNDDTKQWAEMKIVSLLSSWGYSDIPPNVKMKTQIAFDRAMRGV